MLRHHKASHRLRDEANAFRAKQLLPELETAKTSGQINRIQDLEFNQHFRHPFILNQPSYLAQNPQKSCENPAYSWRTDTISKHFYHTPLPSPRSAATALNISRSAFPVSSLKVCGEFQVSEQSESRQIQLKTLPCVFLLRGCYSTVTWWTCISCGETVKR